jgi:hypothetical protein
MKLIFQRKDRLLSNSGSAPDKPKKTDPNLLAPLIKRKRLITKQFGRFFPV